MQCSRFEKLLGNHISIAVKAIGNDFENKLYAKSFYYIPNGFIKKDFHGMSYNMITILPNEKNIVQSISIHFEQLISLQLYNSLIEKYGIPDSIQIIKDKQLESESIIKDDNGKISEILRKSNFDLKEGSFEDKPLYIIWRKENFKIVAFQRHKQNISEIIFSLK